MIQIIRNFYNEMISLQISFISHIKVKYKKGYFIFYFTPQEVRGAVYVRDAEIALPNHELVLLEYLPTT